MTCKEMARIAALAELLAPRGKSVPQELVRNHAASPDARNARAAALIF